MTSQITKTRVPELGVRQDGPRLWRFVDLTDGMESAVGEQYQTKTEALADLERYSVDGGWVKP